MKSNNVKTVFVLSMFLISAGSLFAQNIGINTTGAPANNGAGLDVAFEDKGLLIPRVNIADLTTYAPIGGTPTESMLVYNTNTTTGEGFHYWDGANWVRLMVGSSAAAPADAWETSGNAGTNPSSNFLGTTDAQDLVFRTDNTEQMRLTTAGWLGIGTNAPEATLDVDDDWASVAIQANAPFIRFHQKDVSKEWFTGVHGSSFWLRENCLDVAGAPTSGCFPRISVNPGNVMGINNFNPGSAVDVSGEIRVRGTSNNSAFVNAGELALKNNNSDPRLSFHASNGAEIAGIWSRNNLDLRIANFQDRPMRFFTNSLERVTILGNGDVGVGANNPNSKLTISRTGAALVGSVVSSTLSTNSGTLGGNANDRMKLATLGFTTGNSVSLGVEARRQTTGADWTTTSIGLKFEVDNTTWDNNALWLTAPGNIGVGTTDPTAKLDIDGQIRIRGGAPGAGKVLTSDANGVATWETPAASSGGGGLSQTTTNDATINAGVNFVISNNSNTTLRVLTLPPPVDGATIFIRWTAGNRQFRSHNNTNIVILNNTAATNQTTSVGAVANGSLALAISNGTNWFIRLIGN